jgi:hypothetical protein
MKQRYYAAAALVCGLAAAFVLTASVVAADDPDPVADPGRPIPSLSDDEKARAAELATAELSTLIKSNRFDVVDVGVWHTHGMKPIGAVVVFDLKGAGRFHADWPTIDYDRSESHPTPYDDDHSEYTAAGVTQFLVLVDLKREKVVQVEPSGLDVVTSEVVGNPRRRDEPLGD